MSPDDPPGADAPAVVEWLSGTEEYVNRSAGVRTEARADLLRSFTGDPHRQDFEKETRVMFSRQGSRCEIFTADKAVGKLLLMHPDFALQWFEYATGRDGRSTTAGRPEEIRDGWDGQDVYAVEGTLPIGSLTVKGSPRVSSNTSKVVSDQVRDNDPRGSKKGDDA